MTINCAADFIATFREFLFARLSIRKYCENIAFICFFWCPLKRKRNCVRFRRKNQGQRNRNWTRNRSSTNLPLHLQRATKVSPTTSKVKAKWLSSNPLKSPCTSIDCEYYKPRRKSLSKLFHFENLKFPVKGEQMKETWKKLCLIIIFIQTEAEKQKYYNFQSMKSGATVFSSLSISLFYTESKSFWFLAMTFAVIWSIDHFKNPSTNSIHIQMNKLHYHFAFRSIEKIHNKSVNYFEVFSIPGRFRRV